MSYQSEKFAAARSSLMLPHPKGEANSIASAFFNCSLALDGIDRSKLKPEQKYLVDQLDKLMDTTGLSDPGGQDGLHYVKAKTLTVDDQAELSHVVEELVTAFED